MRILRALFALAVVAAVPLRADALTVDIRLAGPADGPSPRGTLTLRPVAGTSVPPDGTISIRFTDAAHPEITGQVTCPTAGGAFRCELPAGTLDLRIARQGHVPHYRWSVPVAAGRSENLAAIAFTPGASISGRRVAEESQSLRAS